MAKYNNQVWSEYQETWNNANSVQEVCDATGLSKSAARTLASRMRQKGWEMQYHNKGAKKLNLKD